MQFVQAVMYKYSAAFEFGHKDGRRKLAGNLGLLGLSLSVGALCTAIIFQAYYFGKYQFSSEMPFLLSYYFLRMFWLPLDQAFVLYGKTKPLTMAYASSALLKIGLLLAGASGFGDRVVMIYPILGLLDLLIIEVVVRKYMKMSYVSWLVR